MVSKNFEINKKQKIKCRTNSCCQTRIIIIIIIIICLYILGPSIINAKGITTIDKTKVKNT